MSKVYNFAAGPSMLPEEVMKEVQAEFLNYNGMGASVIEPAKATSAAMRRTVHFFIVCKYTNFTYICGR